MRKATPASVIWALYLTSLRLSDCREVRKESAASAAHGTEAGGEATNKTTAADEAEAGAASGRC